MKVGTRVPFIFKAPGGLSSSSSGAGTNSSAAANLTKVIKAFTYVDDISPQPYSTMQEYNIQVQYTKDTLFMQ
jgi:hypothetical protein